MSDILRAGAKRFKVLHIALVVIAGAALLATLGVALAPARRALFCSEIVNPYELTQMFVVTVPSGEHQSYDEAFLHFARKQGLAVSHGTRPNQDVGSRRPYVSYNSTACDGRVYAWSDNVAHPDEFVVTFHFNRLFGSRRAERIRDEFVAEFGPRHKIETEDNDLNRHAVAQPRGTATEPAD